MLTTLFPKAFHRYQSLPLFGLYLDGFAMWLIEQGYARGSRRNLLKVIGRMDRYLRRRGIRDVQQLTDQDWVACRKWLDRRHPTHAGTTRVLKRYRTLQGLLPPDSPPAPTRTQTQLAAYAQYMHDVRGLSASTISHHAFTARALLDFLGYESHPPVLRVLTANDLEPFIRDAGQRLSRASLQHTVAAVRGFLRFLTLRGDVRPGLESQLDTPRLYRLEQLPRALPWETVQAFLRSIDRTTILGLRDYSMFFLIATYGLRASEIVALTLDDVDWRAARLQIRHRKSGAALELPLTDAAGATLLEYLRRVPPRPPYRELFLRARAPLGRLKPTAVTEAFQAWSRRSGLAIPFQGPHCLRHSYAVYLLRRGTPLKTIGDLLGHRAAESTVVYLRLATEDLREVALPVPTTRPSAGPQEVRS